MGVPTWEVGYTSAMPRREDHEVRKGHVGHWIKKKTFLQTSRLRPISCPETSVKNYHYLLCNGSEERSSQPWTSFSSYCFCYWRFCENVWHQQAAPLLTFILQNSKFEGLRGWGVSGHLLGNFGSVAACNRKRGLPVYYSNFKIYIWLKVLKSTNN